MNFKVIREHVDAVDLLVNAHEQLGEQSLGRAVRMLNRAVVGIVEGFEHDEKEWEKTLAGMRGGRGDAVHTAARELLDVIDAVFVNGRPISDRDWSALDAAAETLRRVL